MRRRDQQRRPVRVQDSRGVAVGIGVLDRGNRAPHIVGVLGIPTCNSRIRQRDVELCHQPRVGAQAVALGPGDLLGDLVPVPGRGEAATAIGPKQGLLGLVGGTCAAGGAAQALHLIESCGVLCRVQRGRCRGAELVVAGQHEGGDLGPLPVLRHQEHRSRRTPLAQSGAAVIGQEVEVAVAGANGQHRIGDVLAQRNASGLGGAVRNGGQAGDQRGVECRALGRVELVEDSVGGLGSSRIGRYRARDAALHQEGGCALNGGQRVVDGQTLDRQHASGDRRIRDVALDRLQRNAVPGQHRILLHLCHARERTGQAGGIAGRIGGAQRKRVVADCELNTG